jgi:hypothetical protein
MVVSARAADATTAFVPVGSNAFTTTALPGGSTARITGEGSVVSSPEEVEVRCVVQGIGRADKIHPWKAGEALLTDDELFYPGTEMGVHYVRSPFGLRQNFIVYERPVGEGPIEVRLTFSGAASTELIDANGITFLNEHEERVLDYRDLHCWDAQQRPLSGHFELIEHDKDAVYPIVIDPVSTTPATLLVSSQAGAEFGIAVSTAGDLNGDGRSDVVIGAWQATVGGLTLAGAAYVYFGTNTGISTTHSVTLTSGQQGAQ